MARLKFRTRQTQPHKLCMTPPFLQQTMLILIIKAFSFLGLPLRNIPDDPCEPKRVKDDVSTTKDWPTAASEQMLSVITRRKRAYKTAFTALSAVTLFTFHPLPEFAFLFLFIYCNSLIILITFWVSAPLSVFDISPCMILLPSLRHLCPAFCKWEFIPVFVDEF